jgi:Trk K+ transport system NAD-binding subunit
MEKRERKDMNRGLRKDALGRKVWLYVTNREHTFTRLFLITILTIMIGAALLYVVEGSVNPGVSTFGDAIMWVLVFLVSGFDVSPATGAGRTIGIALAFLNMLYGSAFTAILARTIFQAYMGRGKKVDLRLVKDHILICGWQEDRTKDLVAQLHAPNVDRRTIVIIDPSVTDHQTTAEGDKPLFIDKDTIFVKGDPTKRNDLEKARVHDAYAALILSDMLKTPAESDSLVLLTCLTIESMNKKVHTCVEIREPENEEHLVMAHADEIVKVGEVTGHLLVQGALSHGVTKVYKKLLSPTEGECLFEVEVPIWAIDLAFGDLAKRLIDAGLILVGLLKGRDAQVNPPVNEAIQRGAKLLVIARDKPDLAKLAPDLVKAKQEAAATR